MKPLDLTRYKLERPSGKKERDIEEWRKARDNARAQLEHQSTRILNLELLSKYGPNAWRTHGQDLEGTLNFLKNKREKINKDVEDVNATRKEQQLNVQPKLMSQKRKYIDLVGKNMELEYACATIEKDVKQLKETAVEKGLEKEGGVDADEPTAMEE
jgi:pre-mRNA-splicing factor SPF27